MGPGWDGSRKRRQSTDRAVLSGIQTLNTNTPVVAPAMTVLSVMATEPTERFPLDRLRTPASFQPVVVLSNNNAPSPRVPYPKPTTALLPVMATAPEKVSPNPGTVKGRPAASSAPIR